MVVKDKRATTTGDGTPRPPARPTPGHGCGSLSAPSVTADDIVTGVPNRVVPPHGRRFRSTEVAGIPIARVEHEPGAVMPEHAHDQASLTLVVAGGFNEMLKGRRYRYTSMTVVYKPPGVAHATLVEGGPVLTLNLTPPDDLVRRLDLAHPVITRAGPPAAALLDVALALDCAAPDAAAQRLATCLELLGRIPPASDRGADWEAHALLRAGIPIGEISRRLGIDPATLRRRIHRRSGAAPTVLRRRNRVARAADLLTGTPLAIAAVAAESGFADQAHLTRCMRREIGLTPRRLRSLAQSFSGA